MFISLFYLYLSFSNLQNKIRFTMYKIISKLEMGKLMPSISFYPFSRTCIS